ncbi:MAG: hypothetical protein OSA83_13340, partial [Pseudomonadales bacterium]|nr:hypothetical protein [Pseudomonadales bacterium]
MDEKEESGFDWRVHLRSCREEILSDPWDMESAYQKLTSDYEGLSWADRQYTEEFDNPLEGIAKLTFPNQHVQPNRHS